MFENHCFVIVAPTLERCSQIPGNVYNRIMLLSQLLTLVELERWEAGKNRWRKQQQESKALWLIFSKHSPCIPLPNDRHTQKVL